MTSARTRQEYNDGAAVGWRRRDGDLDGDSPAAGSVMILCYTACIRIATKFYGFCTLDGSWCVDVGWYAGLAVDRAQNHRALEAVGKGRDPVLRY